MKKIVLSMMVLAAVSLVAAQTLVYGLPDEPSSLDVVDVQDGNARAVGNQIAETLIGFEPGTTTLEPRLATSWESNEDGSVWTFELRERVDFHDGTSFDADAVEFNFDRWNVVDHAYGLRDDGRTHGPWGGAFGGPGVEGGLLEEVVVVDEHTVEFRMATPAPFLPAQVAADQFQIHSPRAVMDAGADYGTPGVGSVGTGPFEFVEWVEGQQVTVAANGDYWGGAPNVQEVVFRPITEPGARLAELQSGSIDIAVLLSVDDLDTVETDADLEAAIAEVELNVGYLAFHQSHEPFDDPLVRRAVAHAIDREVIVEAFYQDLGVLAQGHLPPMLLDRGEPWPYDYDPQRARELLEAAGHPDGFATELWYMPLRRPYNPAPQPIAETMASYLADVGIEVQLMTEGWASYQEDYAQGHFPMYLLGWTASYADPHDFLMTMFGPAGAEDPLAWDAPDVEDMLRQARETANPDERAALYARVIDRVAEEAASIPMAHNRTLNAVRSNIGGWTASPLGYGAVSLLDVTKE